jgi:uncharacterized protein (DUF885 family)
MTDGLRRSVAAALVLGLAAAALPAQRSIDRFFDDFTTEWIRSSPNQAAAARLFTGEEQRQFERSLTPLTREHAQGRVGLARRGLQELRAFDRTGLSDVQRVSAELMEWQLESVLAADRYSDLYFPFQQFSGANVSLVSVLTVSHPVVTEQDAENYVARLAEVAPRMEEAILEAQRIADLGYLPPRFIVRTTIAQMEQFIASPPAGNPYVTSLTDRMATAGIPEPRRAALAAEADTIVGSRVYPVWRRAIAVLQPLEQKATDAAGLWRFTEGEAAYAEALRRFTTTRLSAEEIHQVGLREVARLEGEMDTLLRKIGRAEGSVRDRVGQLKKDLSYPITDEGRARIMADIEQMMRDAERRAEPQFDRRPSAPVVARPYPRFQEATAAASYAPPALDGSRPGIFQMPLRPERMTKFALRTLVHHEAVPGHHFQIALELENQDVPQFRRLRAFGGISAFSEGWALYAERLAAESGWYDGDPEGLLGQLDAALFRARRLVVDTGLHAKRWTRQQAIDYGIEASEVERYVVFPGQACSYMLGQLEIVRLREKARSALGPRFSIRGFHDLVLGTGMMPLELLEKQVDGYIARERARGSAQP